MKEFYKTYDLEDFLCDEDFLSDVKQHKLTQDQLQNFLADNPKAMDAANQAFAIMTGIAAQNPEIDVENLWSKIDQSISEEAVVVKKSASIVPLVRWISGIAAGFLLMVMLVKNIYNNDQTFTMEVTYGNEASHVLPDGSTIYLNAGSKLQYDKTNFNKERVLFLEGEAYFAVEKGEKFKVKTPNGEVEVLGTTFNVFSRDTKFQVACTTGKVRVTNLKKDVTEILLPDQVIQFEAGKLAENTLTNRYNWRNKKLEYEGASPIFVIDDISRQFDLQIDMNAKQTLQDFSGEIPLSDPEAAIKAFTWPLRLNYTIEGKNVTIY